MCQKFIFNRICNIADGKGFKKCVKNLFLNRICNYCRRQRFQAIIADGKGFKKDVKNLFSNRIRNIADGKGFKKCVKNLFLNRICNYCRRQRFQAINADGKGFKKWRRKFICFFTLSNEKREKEALYIPHRFFKSDFKN
jgi:hypothetical protein